MPQIDTHQVKMPRETIPAFAPGCAATVGVLARRGGLYLGARYGLSLLIGLGNMLVMTWWIGPHAYGLFVTAVGLTTFFAGLSRCGADTYLIRSEPLPPDSHYNVAFTLISCISAALVLLGLCLIPVLKAWYGGSELVLPYLVLLASVPLTALVGVPTARLERDLNFRVLAGIELIGQSIAFVSSLCLALCGLGVWAPVCGMLLWQVFLLTATCRAAAMRPRFAYDYPHSRKMLAYGAGVTLSLRTWQLRTLINPVFVGRFAGLEAVAYVAFALRIADGLGFLRTVASRLGIAALARLQHNREAFGGALEKALLVQVITLGPLLGAFVLFGPWITQHFLGHRWLQSVALFPFVAAGVLVNSVFNLLASALFAIGQEWAVLRAYSFHVLLLAGATCVLLPRVGVVGYGWAELIACTGYIFILSRLDAVAKVSYRRILPVTSLCLLPPVLQIASFYR